MSLAFAGILFTALITVAGEVIAIIPINGIARVASVIGYVLISAALFWWGVTKGRGPVIAFSRKLLGLPPNRG